MYIKAKSPAVLAEKYLIQSIWNNHYQQGSLLPAERELAESIGVTRTTLREVLQRLARDGWLTIQHGKPTQVNDVMQTAGLNILDTILTLQGQDVYGVLRELLSARADLSAIFMRVAIDKFPQKSAQLATKVIEASRKIQKAKNIEALLATVDTNDQFQLKKELKLIPEFYKEYPEFYQKLCLAKAFTYYDYFFFQQMAMISQNRIYLLMMNGMRKIYSRVAGYYFLHHYAQDLTLDFYQEMHALCCNAQAEKVKEVIVNYSKKTDEIWNLKHEMILDYVAKDE